MEFEGAHPAAPCIILHRHKLAFIAAEFSVLKFHPVVGGIVNVRISREYGCRLRSGTNYHSGLYSRRPFETWSLI